MFSSHAQSSTTTDVICTSERPAEGEKRAVVHSVQNISHDKTLPDNGAVIYRITDGLMSGFVQPSSLVTLSAWISKKWHRAANTLFVCSFSILQLQTVLLVRLAREALMVRSILMNSLFFFLKKKKQQKWSFKSVNRMSNKHFPEPLPVGDQAQTCSSENEMRPQVT